MSEWRFNHLHDSAQSVHSRELPAERGIWRVSIDDSALVLGSKQDSNIVDQQLCTTDGITVVRRRSGGGAVFLQPNSHLWFDFVVPIGDELWRDDVGESMWWVGELWVDALARCEVADRDQFRVHHGALERRAHSDLICFAGLGPGEVTLHGEKVVGIAQRRTREMARFQCVVHKQWSADAYCRYLIAEKITPTEKMATVSLRSMIADIGVAEVSGLNQIADAIVELAALI